MKNKKGFTLIELLAVIVILALLVAVAIPAVTKYLNTARRGTVADNAQTAISAVRNDYISNGYTADKTYSLEYINSTLLDKKIEKSPFNNSQWNQKNSCVVVDYKPATNDSEATTTYHVCLESTDGASGINQDEASVVDEKVVAAGFGKTTCDSLCGGTTPATPTTPTTGS